MDKILHTHLDNRLNIQDKMSEKLNQLFLRPINLREFLNSPQFVLTRIAKEATKIMQDASQEAASEGVRFAKAVKKRVEDDKVIVVKEADDPKANAT